MAFVNEKFTPEDHDRYHFDNFDRRQVAFPNPSRYLAINWGDRIFQRMVRVSVGDNFDPRQENQFHRYEYPMVKHALKRKSDSGAALYEIKEKCNVIEMK